MTPANPPLMPLRIMVVDDESNIRLTLSICLESEGHHVVAHGDIHSALDDVGREAYDLIFLDLRLGMDNGLDFIPRLLQENPWTRIVVITAYASVETAVEAMKCGASDYLPKPFEASQVLHVTQKVAERRQIEKRLESLALALDELNGQPDMPTVDPVLLGVLDLARQVAQSQANLIIAGEIGAGKSRLAHAIHLWSNRAGQPFVAVNCRAENPAALEVELFGAPASVGAGRVAGKVDLCDGGTLLLDEVAELPMALQPAILRLLKDREFERQDDATCRRTRVRVIATTSVDLQHCVDSGMFRADLLLALNVVQLDLPPLRRRKADILPLAECWLAYFCRREHRNISGFDDEARRAITQHHWPGNTRELRNMIERAVLLCRDDTIGIEHLPPNLLNSSPNISIGDWVPLAMVEEMHIRRVVASARSLRQAATILGIDSGTVVRRMKRYGASDDQPAA